MGDDDTAMALRAFRKLDREEQRWVMGRIQSLVEHLTEMVADMPRDPGQRRPWGTPALRREMIAIYRDYLSVPNPKTTADDFAGFNWRTIENWPEWDE